MLDTLFAKIGAILIAPIIAITGFFSPEPPAVGTALPQAVAIFETSLAAPITADATTMTLTANSIRGGGSLSGFNCFTVDEGSSQAEFICGNVATTTVTDLQRGISPADGVTQTASLKFSHRRGTNVKITDFPIIQRLKLQNDGEGTFENALSYASGVIPTGNNHLTDVEYVLSVVTGGTVSFDQMILTGTAGETMATGTLVYLDGSDQEWKKVDVDTSTTFVDKFLGITQGNGTDGNTIIGGILIKGRDNTQTGLTPGSTYYASTSAGVLSTDVSLQPIGVADDTDTLIFDPKLILPSEAGDNTWTGTNSYSATSTFSGGYLSVASTTRVVGLSQLIANRPVTTYSNSDAEQTIISYPLPANLLGGENAIRLKAWFTQADLAASTVFFRVKLGSSTVHTFVGSSTAAGLVTFDLTLSGAGSLSAQESLLEVFQTTVLASSTRSTATEDASTSLPFSVTVQAGSSSYDITNGRYILEYILR